MENSSRTGGISSKSNAMVARRGMRIENPFTFKVGQVFTGFGVGCGVGIGVGRPINLGAIPILNQVMSATGGATDILYGVGRHANNSMRKLGVKNIEAGLGCGVGFGHGFGVGLAVKPGVMHQIQSSFLFIKEAVTKMMMKFGIAPNLSIDQGFIPPSLQSGMMPAVQNPVGGVLQLATKVPDQTPQSFTEDGKFKTLPSYETFASKSSMLESSYGTQTEKVISSFLQNPLFEEEVGKGKDLTGFLRSENSILHMVLKHQKVIEELMEENERLRQILVEDLKIPPAKLQSTYPSKSISPCVECFECRRKQRRK